MEGAARPTPEEPTVAFIHQLARDGLEKVGHHGPMVSMGVPRQDLPRWDDLQILTAQLARRPLADDAAVGVVKTAEHNTIRIELSDGKHVGFWACDRHLITPARRRVVGSNTLTCTR